MNKKFTSAHILRVIGLIETSCFKSTLDIDKSWTFKSRFNFYVDSTHAYMHETVYFTSRSKCE